MIAREDHHVIHIIAVDDVDILGDRIGGAAIPGLLVVALRGGQDIEKFVAFGPEEAPAALAMADEAVGLVLRGNRHLSDAGIERVRECEIHDPGLAAEIDYRFDASVREFLQA